MKKTIEKKHSDPFIIDGHTLKLMHDFILKYADNCSIEIITATRKEKESREYKNFAELDNYYGFSAFYDFSKTLTLEDVAKKVNYFLNPQESENTELSAHSEYIKPEAGKSREVKKIILRGYKDDKEIICLYFKSPKYKIFPFTYRTTLKSFFKFESDEEYSNFIKDYDTMIWAIFYRHRHSYVFLHSLLPSFFSGLLSTIYALPRFIQGNEDVIMLSIKSLALFLLLSIAINAICYPILYYFNPLVHYNFNTKVKR